jgi:signal transduction histidine kinase
VRIFHRLPVRLRLVAGFVVGMLVVLTGAAAFVFWRVQISLDHRLDQDLRNQTLDLGKAATRLAPRAAIASLLDAGRDAQLLTGDGRVLASGSGIAGRALLTPSEAQVAAGRELHAGSGNFVSKRPLHLRILARPVRGRGGAAVAATAVRLDQRDEALRELVGWLAIGGGLALAVASVVGYLLARAALDPVERYRRLAERITRGATGVRLDVPESPSDEITRLGTTLNEMIDAHEQSIERQQQLVDDASHELRTPLTALAAEIDLALRRPRNAPEYEATLRRLAGDVDAVLALADSLLELGAVGSTPPAFETVAVPDLLRGARDRTRHLLDGPAGRTITVDVSDGLRVRGDGALLARAVANLVENAVRHGEGVIRLTARAADAGSAVVVGVHDDGEIAAEFLPHAIERFRQGERSRTGAGAGLGLSLVDAIARVHHGQLRLCSHGHHHRQPAAGTQVADLPCRHPSAGTTGSLLLPSG